MMHIDWNLLRLMAVLYRTGNVSRAAEELGLSQSAVSHALGRLREQFDDPLFVRTARGVVPTEVALELRTDVEEVVRRAEALAERRSHRTFDPRTATGRITVATTGYFEVAVLSLLVSKLAEEAPGIQLSIRPTGITLPKDELERGRVDVAIAGFYAAVPEGFYQTKLFDDAFRTAIPTKARASEEPPTEEEFFAARHALITLEGDFADRFAKRGNARRFVYGTTSFSSLAWVMAQGSLWLTAPGRLVERYADHFPLRVFECPLPTTDITIRMVWHERTHRDPLRAWFRERLRAVR